MSTTRLQGKVALVTGGASGIGLAIVETFLSEGARVFVVDFGQRHISNSATALGEKFDANKFAFVEGDAANEDSVKGFVNECVVRFDGLDIAILNAGVILRQKPLLEFGSTDYEHCMRVNA
jgi:NAD(P)-dependent dehydrogenase (short-subunit alcohol dehydrogenase family)